MDEKEAIFLKRGIHSFYRPINGRMFYFRFEEKEKKLSIKGDQEEVVIFSETFLVKIFFKKIEIILDNKKRIEIWP